MNEEQLKAALKEEIDGLKKGVQHFVKREDMEAEVAKVMEKAEGIDTLKGSLDELKKAMETQGEQLTKLIQGEGEEKEKSIRDILKDNIEQIEKIQKSKNESLQFKTVVAANATNDDANYREPGVREIQRGQQWISNLFNRVQLGTNTHGSIDWWEQLAITDNSSTVAEGGASATQSNLTWVRKTLSDKIIHDFIKVSKDQLKDIDFVQSEIMTLVNRNMRLKENSQLLLGGGTGNDIKGITHADYAQAFATAGISISNATLNDLIGKIKTQIRVNSKDGFMPNYHCGNSNLYDLIRYAKDDFGQYVFPLWATGGSVAMQGMQAVENNLIADNALLVGDFSLGTVYYWDGLVIEMGYVNDDFTNNLVTISARMRENLRIKDNDVQGFVYVSDVAAAITAIDGGA